ncbi:MAG: F0F1 ATP synthase subunit alpha, partial [Desulfomonilaceae bacterium]
MSSILQEIEARIANVRHEAKQQNVGVVSEIGDGVAKIEGLDDLMMNEMIDLGHGVTGIAMNLEETSVGAILMGDYTKVS